MTILLTIAGISVILAMFWRAMIEAQEQAGIEAENRAAMKDAEHDDRPGECPQCGDPGAILDEYGDAMCEECGLGCAW